MQPIEVLAGSAHVPLHTSQSYLHVNIIDRKATVELFQLPYLLTQLQILLIELRQNVLVSWDGDVSQAPPHRFLQFGLATMH